MPHRHKLRLAIPCLAVLALMGCGKDALTPDLPPVTPAGDKARCPAGSLLAGPTSGGVLTPEESPYHLQQSLVIGQGGLTVLPGVTICADSANSFIIEGPLKVLGTAQNPVHFTWLNPDTTHAIRHGRGPNAPVVLKHATFVGAGIETRLSRVEAEDVVIRGTHHEALTADDARLTRVTIDSTCTADCVVASVWVPEHAGRLILEDVTIRESGATAIHIRSVADLQVDGLTLESIAGDGIQILFQADEVVPGVQASSPIRFARVDGDVVDAPALVGYLLASAGLVALDGTVADVALDGRFPSDRDVQLGPGPRWRILGRSVEAVTLLPGARVEFPDSTGARSIVAKGTLEAPVTFEGGGHLVLYGERGTDYRVPGEGPVLEYIAVRNGLEVTVLAPRTRIEHGEWIGAGTLRVAGTARDVALVQTTFRESEEAAVEIQAAGVSLDRCQVTRSASDGIVVRAVDARIRSCNIFDNAGDGVVALGVEDVDARGNWWGAMGGPGVAGGDGIRGAVDVSGALEGPVRLDVDPDPTGVAVRIEVDDTLEVETGTAVVIQAVARDAGGRPTFGAPIAVSIADPTRARLDPDHPKVVVGLRPGITTATVSIGSDSSVSSEVVVRVVPGGPAFDWSGPELTDRVDFGGIWAPDPDDVFVVGRGHTVHYDGSGWNDGVSAGLQVHTVFGSGGRIFSSGSRGFFELPADRRAWRVVAGVSYGFPYGDLWMAPTGEVFSAGSRQSVYEGDPDFAYLPAPPFRCTSVWGRSATEVYFACEDGVLRWDGSTFAAVDVPVPGKRSRAVWTTDDYVWAVGDGGSARRISTVGSETVDTGTRSDLLEVHGTDDNDVFVVGGDDTLLHWDGSTIRSLWVPGTGDITHVWTVGGHVFITRDGEVLAGAPLR